MAQTLEELRTALAQAVARHFAGTATDGGTTTLVDAAGLARWTETDALKGAYLHILEAGGSAPEGEWRRIKSFNTTTLTITVDRAFSAAVGTGDTYEVFLSPLTLDQWDQCINDAIKSAWPQLFAPATEDVAPTGALTYSLSANADRVLGAEVTFKGTLAGFPSQPLIEWYVTGNPGSLVIKLSHPVPNDSTNMAIRVVTGQRFDELSTGESTALDPQYVMDAGRAAFYQRMADASRQADRQSLLQLMAHWQEQAKERKLELASGLLGLQQSPKKKEEK